MLVRRPGCETESPNNKANKKLLSNFCHQIYSNRKSVDFSSETKPNNNKKRPACLTIQTANCIVVHEEDEWIFEVKPPATTTTTTCVKLAKYIYILLILYEEDTVMPILMS
jgi:hypothetical protein